MVGFLYNPTVNKEEGEENLNQPLELKKSTEPLDISFPELEDFSLSFIDSLLDFNDWIEEKPDPSMADLKADHLDKVDSGNLKPDPSMADLKADHLDKVESGNVEFLEKSMEIGEEESFEKTSLRDGSSRLWNLGSLIEEEMGKVSLGAKIVGSSGNGVNSGEITSVKCESDKNGEIVGAVGDGVMSCGVASVDGNDMKNGDKLTAKEKNCPKSGDIVSDGDSEPSSSSSSSDDDDDDNDDEEEEEEEGEMDMEEGEIRAFEGEDMVAWSEDEDGGGAIVAGPVRSKNELQVLPVVPPLDVVIQPHHQTLPVGVVLSIMGAQVIVEGVEKHNPLSEGSILWITESRTPLGFIDEIFGPVKNPYYVVRYNSDSEVPSGIEQGSSISFVPEFADYVLNNNNLYKKGYDASGENDEELSDEVEFSDDEKEAEFKRMIKMSKRGMNEQKNGNNMMKGKKKSKNRGDNWRNEQPPLLTSQAPLENHASSSRPVGPVQSFSGWPGMGPTFPQVVQAPNFSGPSSNFTGPSSGVWTNGIPCVQPHSMGFSMPWTQQNFPQQPYQMPFPTGAPFHQQFNTNQMLATNFALQGGQPNFCVGPACAPWPANMGQNCFNQSQLATGVQSMFPPPSMNVLPQGVGSNGLQMEHNNGVMRPHFLPGNGEASRNSNQASGGGHFDRGGGRRPFRRGGGSFRGGRRGQQPR